MRRLAAAALLTAAIAVTGVTAAQLSERYAVCAASHGAGGVSSMAESLSLAGQHPFCAITQLFLLRLGRHANVVMTAMVKDMNDADLRACSDLISELPAAPAAASAAVDPARMARGAALAKQHRCGSCHGDAYTGEKRTPRIGGQREDYLAKTLAESKAGPRAGYTSAMNEVLAGVGVEALPELAYYLTNVGR